MITYRPPLVKNLAGGFLILDTNVIIDAYRSEEFLDLLIKIGKDCGFLTVPSVLFEFLNNKTGNPIAQTKKREFVNKLNISIDTKMEEFLEENQELFLVLGRATKKTISYTDFLLLSQQYKHQKSSGSNTKIRILTTNHHDMPTSIIKATESITFDIEGEIRAQCMYVYDLDNYISMLKKILHEHPS